MDTNQRKTGRPGVPDKKILEAIDGAIGKGLNPTVNAVQAISGGSRQRVGEILAQRRMLLHGTMSPPLKFSPLRQARIATSNWATCSARCLSCRNPSARR